MDVSKNRGTPKWMVYNGKPYFLMDDLRGKRPILIHLGLSMDFHVSLMLIYPS